MKCSLMVSSLIDPHISQPKLGKDKLGYSQGKTGYCWLVLALHCVSEWLYQKKGEVIRFSKGHLIYYDKIEKANKFLSQVIAHIQEPVDTQVNSYIFSNSMTDRGQWEMAANLIKKYGLMPENCYSDPFDQTSTTELNAAISYILCSYGAEMRRRFAAERNMEDVVAIKKEAAQSVFNLLSAYLETPQKYFEVEIRGKPYTLTAPKYFRSYVAFPFNHYMSIYADDTVLPTRYSIQLDGNIKDMPLNTFYSVPDNIFSLCVNEQIQSEKFCWCSIDAGKFYVKSHHILDDSIFDLSLLTKKTLPQFNRSEVLKNHIASMSHAVVIMENLQNGFSIYDPSFSAENGAKCFMSDSWFQKYVFQAIVQKSIVKPYNKVWATEVSMPWEFFGVSCSRL